jgi:hypothetical protein
VNVRITLLALAGGAGILLYLDLWAWTSERRPLLAIFFIALAMMSLLLALGFSAGVFFGIGLMVAGIVLLARRGAKLRPGGSFTILGIVLTVGRRCRALRADRLVPLVRRAGRRRRARPGRGSPRRPPAGRRR